MDTMRGASFPDRRTPVPKRRSAGSGPGHLRSLAVCAAAVAASFCAHGTTQAADSAVRELGLPARTDVTGIHVSPDEKHIVLDGSDGRPALLMFDPDLKLVSRSREPYRLVGFSELVGDRLLRVGFSSMHVLAANDLSPIKEVSGVDPRDLWLPMRVVGFESGWLIVPSIDAEVVRIEGGDSPRLAGSGKPQLHSVRSACLDAKSRTLFLVGTSRDGRCWIEGFDVKQMRSQFTVELPLERLSGDAVVVGDEVLVAPGDESGEVVRFGIADRKVRADRIGLGSKGRVCLARSASGKEIVVGVIAKSAEGTRTLNAVLFDVTGSEFKRHAALTTEVERAVQDVAILSSKKSVIFTGGVSRGFVWTYE